MKNIILASASPRRKALLEQIGLSFDVIIAKVSESTNSVNPEDVVKDLAYQKAKKVFESHRDSIVIGADTVVYNTKTGKYHAQSCASAKKCTVNCIKIDRKQAIQRGGVPCKICGARN